MRWFRQAVRLTHLPSGLWAQVDGERSLHRCEARARDWLRAQVRAHAMGWRPPSRSIIGAIRHDADPAALERRIADSIRARAGAGS